MTALEPDDVPDDRLRLIFTCCHPALPLEARVALTLRTLCGLTVAEIAHAFGASEAATAKRLVRARQKIQRAGIPYRVPSGAALPARLNGVIAVLYLLFTEGYAPSGGGAVVRPELSGEAIRLTEVLADLMPEEPEVLGLLALERFHGLASARPDRGGRLARPARRAGPAAVVAGGGRRGGAGARRRRAADRGAGLHAPPGPDRRAPRPLADDRVHGPCRDRRRVRGAGPVEPVAAARPRAGGRRRSGGRTGRRARAARGPRARGGARLLPPGSASGPPPPGGTAHGGG